VAAIKNMAMDELQLGRDSRSGQFASAFKSAPTISRCTSAWANSNTGPVISIGRWRTSNAAATCTSGTPLPRPSTQRARRTWLPGAAARLRPCLGPSFPVPCTQRRRPVGEAGSNADAARQFAVAGEGTDP
jgi:hypothetical protein